MSNDETPGSKLTRRSMIVISGTALVSVVSRALPAAPPQQTAQTGKDARIEKPLFLPPPDATDTAVHSRAENLFWCDIMMEHAGFFAMLMPGPELATQRAQAETFQRSFQAQYDRARSATFDQTNFAAFNRSSIELIAPFVEYKQRLHDAQVSGKIRSLVFPLFFDHAAREAQRAIKRLGGLADGNPGLDFSEVVGFWSTTMSDDSEFIAHFLDPQEQDLISQALDSAAVFKGFHQGNLNRKLPGGEILLATEELIDFETTVHDGINAGHIKGILHPALVDHMRRETLKFVDELKRTGTRT